MKKDNTLFKTKKIKFNLKKKNYRWEASHNNYVYTRIDESELHRLIITYCKENNITLKSIKILKGTCTIKLYGNNDDVINLVLYIVKIFCGWIENLSY